MLMNIPLFIIVGCFFYLAYLHEKEEAALKHVSEDTDESDI